MIVHNFIYLIGGRGEKSPLIAQKISLKVKIMELSEKKKRALEDLQSQNWYNLWKNNFGVGKTWLGSKTIQTYLQQVKICDGLFLLG